MADAGPLAIVGGVEWEDGCDFDTELLSACQADEVVVLPTAAAYEHADRSVQKAQRWFDRHGVAVRGLNVLSRRDAEDPRNAEIVASARFIYLSDGSPLHLRSVLKDSLVWEALVTAWRRGAAVAGSSAGAMVLGDPMVDPRGGAFTLGLGLVQKFAVVPHWERWTGDKARRMTQLIPRDVVAVEIEERTALIRWPDGRWTTEGEGRAVLSLAAGKISCDEIEAAVQWPVVSSIESS